MITGKKIPFVRQDTKMSKALKILSEKKLGVLIVRNKSQKTIGIITDGQIRRSEQKNKNLQNLIAEDVMTSTSADSQVKLNPESGKYEKKRMKRGQINAQTATESVM